MSVIAEDDFPWLRHMFATGYPEHFSAEDTEQWMREVVIKSPLRFRAQRTANALCISLITEYPWQPNRREVIVLSLIADNGRVWETLPLLRDSIAWARRREAKCWRLATDMGQDFAPLMKRLGVPNDTPCYKLDLGETNGQNGHH